MGVGAALERTLSPPQVPDWGRRQPDTMATKPALWPCGLIPLTPAALGMRTPSGVLKEGCPMAGREGQPAGKVSHSSSHQGQGRGAAQEMEAVVLTGCT